VKPCRGVLRGRVADFLWRGRGCPAATRTSAGKRQQIVEASGYPLWIISISWSENDSDAHVPFGLSTVQPIAIPAR
jgi:hypothetical protein